MVLNGFEWLAQPGRADCLYVHVNFEWHAKKKTGLQGAGQPPCTKNNLAISDWLSIVLGHAILKLDEVIETS